jgi:hypothetical protein
MSLPTSGRELAELQPVPVPILKFFEWASEHPPQGSISDILSSQLGGRMTGTHFQKPTVQFGALAPSSDQMRAYFEALVISTMTNPTKSLAAPPTARDRYSSVSSHAIGAYLTVARFWIPPDTHSGLGPGAPSDTRIGTVSGGWSTPLLTVIGAPTPTVDALPVHRLQAFPGARTLAPGSFPLPASQELTILAGTLAGDGMIIFLPGTA